MENNLAPSRKKVILIQEEKFIREVDYVSKAGKLQPGRSSKKELLLDLKIPQKGSTCKEQFQKILVSIKPRASPIKTIYVTGNNNFESEKGSEISSRSQLGISDQSSPTTCCNEDDHLSIKSKDRSFVKQQTNSFTTTISQSTFLSECFEPEPVQKTVNFFRNKKRSAQKCYVSTQPPVNMDPPRRHKTVEKGSSLEDPLTAAVFYKLNKRVNQLEQKVREQEMVFRALDPDPTSTEEDCDEGNMSPVCNGSGRPGCSYIQNYSHVPGTSAFQRLAQQSHAFPPSGSHAISLEKEHNSEQYGRDFTTYDGITARGRRQSASVPCKRDENSKGAAERVQRIRHRLPPLRDYRLMDTVHYLAQGEFAPRDDGIKLTPSREAVLSDIIWEDVCRTHWPNARMARRGHSDRNSTRGDLQRLIDGLLHERVQHVERRRRRHYRIVKLNHRNESCRAVGKTGDIIVASHKSKDANEDLNLSDHEASAMMARREWDEQTPSNVHRSHDRLTYSKTRPKHRSRPEDCAPGPSRAVTRSKEPTYCFRASNTNCMQGKSFIPERKADSHTDPQALNCGSSTTMKSRKPRLVVNNMGSGSIRKKHIKEDPNLAHYIVLPTLVIRTPSNVKRQNKFNELYQKILNMQLKNTNSNAKDDTVQPDPLNPSPSNKKNIGLNINIILPRCSEDLNNTLNTNNSDSDTTKNDEVNKTDEPNP